MERVGEDGEQSEWLTRTHAFRKGSKNSSVVPVFIRKRLPTKVAAKNEPGETEKSAIRLVESGFSRTSESPAQSHFRSSPRDLRTKKTSWAPIKSHTEGSPGGVPIEVHGIQQVQTDLPDIVLLYRTLVADGGLPPGFEVEFSTLGPSPRRNGKEGESASSAAWTRLYFSGSRKLSGRSMPKMLRPQQTISYGQRRCHLAGTSPAYSVPFTRDRRPGRTPKKRKSTLKSWVLWSFTLRRLWEGFSGNDPVGFSS